MVEAIVQQLHLSGLLHVLPQVIINVGDQLQARLRLQLDARTQPAGSSSPSAGPSESYLLGSTCQ